MADADLTTYTELADLLDQLPLLLREARRARGLTMRQAGERIGIAPSTVLRVENGQDAWRSTAIAILRWLDRTTPGDDHADR